MKRRQLITLALFAALLPAAAAARKLSEPEEELSEAEEEEIEEVTFHFAVVVGLISLGTTFVVGHMLEEAHVHWMPEAAVGVPG